MSSSIATRKLEDSNSGHRKACVNSVIIFSIFHQSSFIICDQKNIIFSTTYTPPNSEIIWGQNVGTKVVCGIIFFFEKKAMLKIWKKSWVPFWRAPLIGPSPSSLFWAALGIWKWDSLLLDCATERERFGLPQILVFEWRHLNHFFIWRVIFGKKLL